MRAVHTQCSTEQLPFSTR